MPKRFVMHQKNEMINCVHISSQNVNHFGRFKFSVSQDDRNQICFLREKLFAQIKTASLTHRQQTDFSEGNTNTQRTEYLFRGVTTNLNFSGTEYLIIKSLLRRNHCREDTCTKGKWPDKIKFECLALSTTSWFRDCISRIMILFAFVLCRSSLQQISVGFTLHELKGSDVNSKSDIVLVRGVF